MNKLQKKFEQYDKEYQLEQAKDFIKYTNQDIKDITQRFFIIGFRLNEAKEQGYIEALGYPDIETLAEEEFGFKRSTTYGLISVFRRFAEISDNGTYLNYIKNQYKDYSYSQLLEINKLIWLPSGDYIKTLIPPSSSVRDVAAYIKFRKEKAGNEDYSLTQWKTLQEQIPPAIEEQTSAKNTSEEETDFDSWLEKQPEGTCVQTHSFDNDSQTKNVQTSGLRARAKERYSDENWKPLQDVTTIISKEELTEIVKKACDTFDTKLHYPADNGFFLKVPPEIHADNIYYYLENFLKCKNFLIARNKIKQLDPDEKPMREAEVKKQYNFSTREKVREFLQDYRQWDYLHYDPFLRATYRYKFKNGMYLFACEQQIFCGTLKPEDETITSVIYFLNAQNLKSCAEITKQQFEQFCKTHKDEL